MKISQRDRLLLIFLAVILILAGYYFFLLVPQENNIENLKTDLAFKEATKNEIELKFASEKNLDTRIETLEDEIEKNSQNYFSSLTQEETLMIVDKFSEGLTVSFSDLQFANTEPEDSKIIQTSANLQFNSNYESLMAYLRNSRTFEKEVIVKEVNIQNNLADGLSGSIQLEFDSIPSIEAYAIPYKKLVTTQFNTRDILLGPFAPYDNFVVVEPTEATSEVVIDDGSVYPNYPEYPTDETDVDYTDYRPKTQIYGFEDGANFFVGNSEDVTGFVTRSKTKIAGGYSAELNFDFGNARDFSEANVVFDTNPIIITRQADYLGLWVYAYEASNHSIGAVIIDSKGKEYKVEFVDNVNWTQWKEIEAEMPVEISYPCMIQRIYVDGVGYDQKLQGKYLMDQLEVSYPVN